MIPSFLISFRETFEALLIIGIALAYLKKTGNAKFNRNVYWGSFYGVILSIATAALFEFFIPDKNIANQKIFEGITMLIACFFVTTLVIWLRRAGKVAENVNNSLKGHLRNNFSLGITLFALASVYREGFEIVLFLKATYFSSPLDAIFGLVLGIACAGVLAYFFFKQAISINLRQFFLLTGAMLILISAGLVSKAIGEFQEAGVIGVLGQKAWNTHQFLDSSSEVGRIINSIFGYDDNPTVLQSLGYMGYLAIASYLLYPKKRNDRTKHVKSNQ